MNGKTLGWLAAVLCGTAVQAVMPLAQWQGDFGVTNKNGIVLDVRDNVVAGDGTTVTLTPATANGVTFNWGRSSKTYYTVIFRCSGLTLPSDGYGSLITMRVTNGTSNDCNNRPGILLDTAGMAYGVWQDAAWNPGTYSGGPIANDTGRRTFAFRYYPNPPSDRASLQGTAFFALENGAWRAIYNVSGLRGSADVPLSCTIGGFNGDSALYKSLDGMRLEAVAIFNDALVPTDLAKFRFPDEIESVACWDGDFSQTTQGGVTLGVDGVEQTAGGHALTISDAAETGLLVNLPTGTSAATLVVKCANVVPPASGYAAFASVRASGVDNRVATLLDADNVLSGAWNAAPWQTATYNGALSEQGGQRCFAFRYNPQIDGTTPGRGVLVYEFVAGAWQAVYRSEPLQSGADANNLKVISFGGPTSATNTLGVLAGLRIDALAVFDQVLDEESLLRFLFASDRASNHAVATTGSWSAQAWDAAWTNSPRSDISLALEGTETAVVTADADLQMSTLTLSGTGGLQLTGSDVDVQIGVLDAREATGSVQVDVATGCATVKAGADLTLAESGTGALEVPSGSAVCLGNGWQGSVSGAGAVEVDADGACSLLDRDAFTGSVQLTAGTLEMLAGHEGTVNVAAGATLKLRFTDDSYLNGYTAEGVTLPAGGNVLFVQPNGTEIVGEGTSLPRPTNVWTASGEGVWSDATKWSLGHVPEFGENVVFRNAGAVTVTLAAGMTQVGNVALEGTGDVRFEGVLALRGEISVPSGRTLRLVLAEGAEMTAPKGVVGGGTLAKAGAGTLAVQPDDGNVALMLGATQVEEGLLTLAGGRIEGAFALAAGAQLDATGALVSSNAVSFAAASNATVFATSAARLSAAGALTVDGDAPLTFACMTACGGTFTVGTSGVVLARASTFDGPVVGAGSLTISGAAATFRGAKAGFTGRLVIEAGAMATTFDGAFGTGTVEGTGVFRAQGVLPNADLCVMLQSGVTWKGTCWLYAISGTCADLNPSVYGNAKSRVRLTGVIGYLPKSARCDLPVELVDENGMKAFTVNNGYSPDDMLFTFAKVSGNGTLQDANQARQIINILDGSEFSGDINVNATNSAKRIVFGTMATPPGASPSITVSAGHTNTIGRSNTWRAREGIYVYGVVKAAIGGNLCVGAYTTSVAGTGVVEFHMNGDYMDDYTNTMARITGTGTIRYTGTARYLQNTAALRFASTLQIENELEKYLVLTEYGSSANPALITIGSLSGSGDICTAFYGGWNSRSLRVVQSRDTVWSGSIDGKTSSGVYDRFHTLHVDGVDGAAARTLTLAGDNSRCTNILNVCSNGSVRLTGSWRGDVTVAGAFGGSGTILDGTLALQDGATLDLRAGVVTAPALDAAGGTLTVVADELPKAGVKLVNLPSTAAPVTVPRAVLRVGGATLTGWGLTLRADGLYLSPSATMLILR